MGPRVTLSLGDIPDAFGGDIAIGADLRYQFADLPVQGSEAFDFYFADEDITVFTIDVNAFYVFDVGETLAPYVGVGLSFTNISFDLDTGFGSFSGDTTETGLNLVGGTEFMTGESLTPFVQAQFTVGDLDRFGLTGGLLSRCKRPRKDTSCRRPCHYCSRPYRRACRYGRFCFRPLPLINGALTETMTFNYSCATALQLIFVQEENPRIH